MPRVEFVLGGPWDGRIEAVDNIEILIPVRQPMSMLSALDPSRPAPRPVHVYTRARVVCDNGCCDELVMEYRGIRG